MDDLQMAHATSASGTSSLGLEAPVICKWNGENSFLLTYVCFIFKIKTIFWLSFAQADSQDMSFVSQAQG